MRHSFISRTDNIGTAYEAVLVKLLKDGMRGRVSGGAGGMGGWGEIGCREVGVEGG